MSIKSQHIPCPTDKRANARTNQMPIGTSHHHNAGYHKKKTKKQIRSNIDPQDLIPPPLLQELQPARTNQKKRPRLQHLSGFLPPAMPSPLSNSLPSQLGKSTPKRNIVKPRVEIVFVISANVRNSHSTSICLHRKETP